MWVLYEAIRLVIHFIVLHLDLDLVIRGEVRYTSYTLTLDRVIVTVVPKGALSLARSNQMCLWYDRHCILERMRSVTFWQKIIVDTTWNILGDHN